MAITVVGLGPGRADWVTPAATQRLRAPGAAVFVRTRHWPGLDQLLDGLDWTSFDELYERADSLEQVYQQMTTLLLAAGEQVVLAVPGDGTLHEAILARLHGAGAEVQVVPGVPLAVAALAAISDSTVTTDTADGAQLVDALALGGSGVGLRVELNPRWPAVITGVFNPTVASQVKLALLQVYPAEHGLQLVRSGGLAGQQVAGMPISDLDRGALGFDHLTSVVVPALAGYQPTGSAHGLRAIVARLRAPEIGCPWDLEQTHRSLIPFMIEEAYEAVDAIEDDDPSSLADELGDVLLQVALHAEIGDQIGEFDWNDVVRNISAKLIRRHPHVFGDVQVSGAAEVLRNWDRLKAAERVDEPPPASALDGIPKSLPQLKRAAELSRKARKAGFDWPTREGTLNKVREELAELLAASTVAERREELGDLLYILAKLAWQEGVDPEEALRSANQKFARRFAALEGIARERGWTALDDRPLADLESAWIEAKARVAEWQR